MKENKCTRGRLLSSVIALVCCFAMLIGSTFAWFTDSVFSGGNTIRSGNLKIEVMHKVGDEWVTLKDNSNHRIFDYERWEPGYTRVETLKVANLGSLALQWRLSLASDEETVILGDNGENLADVIEVYVCYGESEADSFSAIQNGEEWISAGTLADIIDDPNAFIGGELIPEGEELEEGAADTTAVGEQTVSVALHMNHLAGNGYQGLSLGELYVDVVATQWSYEMDSFGNGYDANAVFPSRNINFFAEAAIGNLLENGALTDAVTVGDALGEIYANVPAGVQIAEGTEAVSLKVVSLKKSQSNVTATHRSEVVYSVDVHMEGVAEGNTVPMTIVMNALLPTGLNSNNVCLYHVENGETVAMTLVDEPVNHNEFSYDPANGNVVMTLASFSEIVLYGDTANEWDGTVAAGFGGGTGTENDPYIIANGEQLAYFRNAVDGGNTFEGKFVKLTANINLNDINFDPIGWGYDYDGFTPDGKTFNGTFDGGNYTIFGLYQNGWDANDCGNTYDYSMAGGGLFASVVDATIKNLTVSGADIVMECIDMGVVVGYAQGNCNFDNISIINCTLQNYNRYTGGVVGECSPRYNADGTPMYSNHVFNNIKVDSTTTVSSLWGSFDTSLGGILGGKWDKNGAETKVTMTNCDVACTIDAFNDVTSAYQWYAYRRAGMLIGNSEQSEDHTAVATFLTCQNVYVYYGEWNNYHYCEFTNQSGSEDADWQNNYPWVRQEAGLSNSAYSNPRYGNPVVDGVAITSNVHTHSGDDECNVRLPFKQLYGGGQGVYGATKHDGVSEGAYTVTYVNSNSNETIKVEMVGDNSKAYTLWDCDNYVYGNSSPISWTDSVTGEDISTIAEGNTKNYIVYTRFAKEFMIEFEDAFNTVVHSEIFTEGSDHQLNMDAINAALDKLQKENDPSGSVITMGWDTELESIDFAGATGNIIVKAKYNITNTDATLTEIHDDSGKLIGYAYSAYKLQSANVVIPSYIGAIPVIQLLDDTFGSNAALQSVVLPEKIEKIGSQVFEDGPKDNNLFNPDNITKERGHRTIYFKGTAETWRRYMDYRYQGNSKYKDYNGVITTGFTDNDEVLNSSWDNGLEKGSRIFFLDENGKVDLTQGYWELYYEKDGWGASANKYTWVYHDHAYTENHPSDCGKPVNDGVYTDYTNNRADADYWKAN